MAAIRAEPQLASVVFEIGTVSKDPAPQLYVVVSSSLGDGSRPRLAGPMHGLTTTHTVYCVGKDAVGARWVGGKVSNRLKDVRMTIAGRNVSAPDPWISRPVVLDRDGMFPLPFGVIQFDLYSEPV